jgi:hypothetical protein
MPSQLSFCNDLHFRNIWSWFSMLLHAHELLLVPCHIHTYLTYPHNKFLRQVNNLLMGYGIGRNSPFPCGLMSLVPILPLVIFIVLRETVREEVWEVITVTCFNLFLECWGYISTSWWQLRSYLIGKVAAQFYKTEINGHGNPLRWPRDTLYPLKLALASPTSGDHSIGIVCLRTKSHGDTNIVRTIHFYKY